MRVCAGFLLCVATAMMEGCAHVTEPALSPEDLVRTRAQERIDMMLTGDLKLSYQYTTPGYRSLTTWTDYARNWAGIGMWLEGVVHDVECNDTEPSNRCIVTVKVLFLAPKQDAATTYLKETWLYVDDGWYLYQKAR